MEGREGGEERGKEGGEERGKGEGEERSTRVKSEDPL